IKCVTDKAFREAQEEAASPPTQTASQVTSSDRRDPDCIYSKDGVLIKCVTERASREAWGREEEAARRARKEEWARQLAKFYETYPVLKGREKCVTRAFNTLSEKTWDNLARTAISFCVAPPPPLEARTTWVKVFTDANGLSSYVDLGRVEAREEHQVTFWELSELFNDDADFLLSRTLIDCDRKLFAPLQLVYINAGQYGEDAAMPSLDWKSALPNTQGEAMVNSTCAARAALVNPPAPAAPRPAEQKLKNGDLGV